MIHGVYANKEGFRSVTFDAGLNVIVAERTTTSSEKDTRNGLGKSTLLDIIDFCLGGSADKGKKLNIEPLKDWMFTLDITLGSNRVKVSRAVASVNRIAVGGSTEGWAIQPDIDEETGQASYSLGNWRVVLGDVLFGVGTPKGERRYTPSYRSLISYFIRTKSGAYLEPFKYLPQQKGIISKVNVTYLLGLSWEATSHIQELEEAELGFAALESGRTAERGSVGELEAQRVQLAQKASEMEEAVASFKVHPQYQKFQEEADQLTRSLHGLANENVRARQRLAHYKNSISSEAPPNTESLEALYARSGVVFGDGVRKTLEDAKFFHETVVSNRRDFLESEVARIESGISEREAEIEKLSNERAKLLDVLKTHGALQEMTKLQERNTATRAELERVSLLIDAIKTAGGKKRKAKEEKASAVKVIELDHEERRAIWEKAIRCFADNSEALYDTPGKLVIDLGDSGYTYRVEIERSGSEGIDKMKIFCFDLALLQLQLEHEGHIRFLIHDTLMYDAVDPRQRARALERAHEVTHSVGAQYICTMNSDMIPRDDLSESFDFDGCVRLTLTDATPAGSLLGMRFERPRR